MILNSRSDFPHLLNSLNLNGDFVELGVAEGNFSYILLEKSYCQHLYSIDRWGNDRGHDDLQYNRCCQKLNKFGDRSIIMKEEFSSAVNKFEDDFFDFIYIDGYAHTGQENGKTLSDWWSKLRKGGIFAGHDYDKKYPKTIISVDIFLKEKRREMFLTNEENLPSWYCIK